MLSLTYSTEVCLVTHSECTFALSNLFPILKLEWYFKNVNPIVSTICFTKPFNEILLLLKKIFNTAFKTACNLIPVFLCNFVLLLVHSHCLHFRHTEFRFPILPYLLLSRYIFNAAFFSWYIISSFTLSYSWFLTFFSYHPNDI